MEYSMLIVDDSEVNRQILTLQFRNVFDIIEAENGKQALDILEQCHGNIDIVLLDLVMPEMGGIELLRRRQSIPYLRSVPVVVITASNETETQLQAFSLGANDYITKPFISEVIVTRIRNVLNSTSRLQRIQQEAAYLRTKAETDRMTGLFNSEMMTHEASVVLRQGGGSNHALLVIDIDHFKAVNDTHGHLVGDHTLRIVADTISGTFRKSDIIGRVGGTSLPCSW